MAASLRAVLCWLGGFPCIVNFVGVVELFNVGGANHGLYLSPVRAKVFNVHVF